MVLRGVSVHANGARSIAPRSPTSTFSVTTGALQSSANTVATDRIMASSRTRDAMVSFYRANCDVGEPDPVFLAGFPCCHDGHCRHPLNFRKSAHLAGLLKVVHRGLESDVHRVIEVTDRPWIHEALPFQLRAFKGETACTAPVFSKHVPEVIPRDRIDYRREQFIGLRGVMALCFANIVCGLVLQSAQAGIVGNGRFKL